MIIGLFWYRLGTPTPNFPSGTVEEIEAAVTKQKEGNDVNVKLYYKTKPVPKNKINDSQLEAVNAWKEHWSKRGVYYWSFKDTSSISRLIIEHLGLYVERTYFLNQNINEATKEYLLRTPTSKKSVTEHLEDFIYYSNKRKENVDRIERLITENTVQRADYTKKLRKLMKQTKSSKIQMQIALLLVNSAKVYDK